MDVVPEEDDDDAEMDEEEMLKQAILMSTNLEAAN